MSEEEKLKCPKCDSTQLTTDKRGFSGGKAVAGAVLTGGIGLLAGLHGKDKLVIYCMACGEKWKPGEYESRKQKHNQNKAMATETKHSSEIRRLYVQDKQLAYDYAEKHKLLNARYKTIEQLYKKYQKEHLISMVILSVLIIGFIALIYQCTK